ncbi:MAG TPA: chromosome partitioning protein ParB [Desulfonauticus sp.]|jgi:ParB family chromosome partitioning protein|nr:MAG: Chromosome segregation DNA-binding protein [Desulfonauticus sp. 38_4375]MDK2921098.1 ParB family transcriptional regulator, chromosome partitioning protein [Desulfonauticus sp.]HCO12455.1 chromosome partitioning protein ParB [Desulfonauticus sp.]
MNKKRGLGKGLDALLGDWQEQSKGIDITFLDISLITANPNQPRENFDPESLKNLAQSIKSEGVLQPILVRPKDNHYQIVAGERRWRAAKLAGLEKIPAIIREISDQETLFLALIENIHREDLNALEQAKALKALKEEFNLSQEELAQKVNLSRSQVANLLRLLNLPPEVQQLIEDGSLSGGHGKALASLKDPQEIIKLAREIIENNLSVREVEQKTQKAKKAKSTSLTVDKHLSKIMEECLRNKLHLKSKVKGNKEKGKIILEYNNQEEFSSLLKFLNISLDI